MVRKTICFLKGSKDGHFFVKSLYEVSDRPSTLSFPICHIWILESLCSEQGGFLCLGSFLGKSFTMDFRFFFFCLGGGGVWFC